MQALTKHIGTHSGVFHADEVLACTMLQKYTKNFYNAQITRTRDLQVLDTMDIVVDVGGIFDPQRNRFDHHMKEFKEIFDQNYSFTRLSSAGLVYKYYGYEILTNLINQVMQNTKNLNVQLKIDENTRKILYYKLYDQFLVSVDAMDNGVSQFQGFDKPIYKVNTIFQDRISRLNPFWTETNVDENKQFQEAMKIADEELNWQIKILLLSWLPSRTPVIKALQERNQIYQTGEIICLDVGVAWKEHLQDLERELGIEGNTKYVLFPEQNGKAWRVQAVPVQGDSYNLRKPLKSAWRGKAPDDLIKISQIQDIIFVHASGFIGGAKSKESALKMALESLLDNNQ